MLRDMLPSDDGSLCKRLVSILRDHDHGQALQEDLRSGLLALPEVDARDRARPTPAGERRSATAGRESETRRGELKGGGRRVSRHYYDVYWLPASEIGRKALEDVEMAEDWVRQARKFFNGPDLDMAPAVPGSFVLTPHHGMLVDLRPDYEAMFDMVFGSAPTVDEVVEAIAGLEQRINRGHAVI